MSKRVGADVVKVLTLLPCDACRVPMKSGYLAPESDPARAFCRQTGPGPRAGRVGGPQCAKTRHKTVQLAGTEELVPNIRPRLR